MSKTQMELEEKFPIGTCVKLKSGGVTMIVIDHLQDGCRDNILCTLLPDNLDFRDILSLKEKGLPAFWVNPETVYIVPGNDDIPF